VSIHIDDSSAALVASPRPCAPVAGARVHADDAQPRLLSRSGMPSAYETWRHQTGFMKQGFRTAAAAKTQDGRTAFAGAAYVTTDHSTRSGPPTSRPPA
jgi:hypothetical protein